MHPLTLVFVFLVLWLALFGLLTSRPQISLDRAEGLYQVEGNEAGGRPFQWTSSLVHVPVRARTGTTALDLALAAHPLPDRLAPQVRLETDHGALGIFRVEEEIRHYNVLLPPGASELLIYAPVTLAPQTPYRWLGVQLYELRALGEGFPLGAARRSLLLALACTLVAWANAWVWRRGYGVLAATTTVALAVRGLRLATAPAGFHQDELVSIVDAWHLARTGHDHLGHFLPLGALESFGDWVSPLLVYLELPGVALVGLHPLVGRLVTVLAGALVVPICYGIARSLRLPIAAASIAALVVALSPWQVALSRIAIPPALVPMSWALSVWAGLRLVQWGRRRDALMLAGVAGIALYAYPTMKLVVPLLLALTLALTVWHHGWRSAKGWLLPVVLLATLWLPFGMLTLLNGASGTRLNQALLQASSPIEWLAAWWHNYSFYWQPAFYYSHGDYETLGGPPDWGMELIVTAPLVILGLALLVWRCCGLPVRGDGEARREEADSSNARALSEWWLVAGALLLAPLPSSVTSPVPHALRAATIAPLYALLVGLGASVVYAVIVRVWRESWRRAVTGIATSIYIVALAYGGFVWFRAYLDYAPETTRLYQDGLLETMQRAASYAPAFDDVWIDTHHMSEPHIYVFAAQPLPPAEIQAQTHVTRQPPDFNKVWQIERYHFAEHPPGIPNDLPTLDVVLDRFGHPQYVIQEWRYSSQRTLVVRRVENASP